ncbi:DUF5786 family protein [Halegenticoccus soli]|uniref:DUF5786 family protein n=1 Tax=Halegenticoccus soli TaxID=1985678 RepID=UPI000C6D8552|nr:DUF5786 family protein [Halegenticoccus soli]
MSMGAYDENEHERREQKTAQIDIESDDRRGDFHGTLEFDAGDSAEALLDQFRKIKGDHAD